MIMSPSMNLLDSRDAESLESCPSERDWRRGMDFRKEKPPTLRPLVEIPPEDD